MAKVIKRGGGTQKPSGSAPAPRQTAKRTGKVIDRQVYQAQQDAQEIITAGENEKTTGRGWGAISTTSL